MSDEQIFVIYFSGMCSMQFHPSNDSSKRMSKEEAAYHAMEMVEITRKFFPEGGD